MKVLQRAESEGTLEGGSVARCKAALDVANDAVKEAALKLDAADAALASKVAERKGIEREVYLRELLHAALLNEAGSLEQTKAA